MRVIVRLIMLLFVLTALLNQNVHSDEKQFAKPPTEFTCKFTELKIEIDGVGNDSTWETAEWIDAFHLPWLGDKARRSKTATKAKVLWDTENLYFFAEMEDRDLY